MSPKPLEKSLECGLSLFPDCYLLGLRRFHGISDICIHLAIGFVVFDYKQTLGSDQRSNQPFNG